MADSIAALINTVGLKVAQTILQSQVVFPTTSSLHDKAILELEYNTNSLSTAIKAARDSIELQDIAANDDVADLLALLEQLQRVVFLPQADRVVIYKGGFNIVKLINTACPASGRSVYVEINSCREKLMSTLRTQNDWDKRVDMQSMIVGIFVAVTVTAVFTEYRAVKN